MVIKTIAPQHNADSDAEPIGPLELYYEGISSLKKKQVSYIRCAFDKGLFIVAAKDVIKQHMAFAMGETEELLYKLGCGIYTFNMSCQIIARLEF